VKHAKVRRSKLYYLRRKDYKVSKLKTKELAQFVAEEEEKEEKPEQIEESTPKEKTPEKKGEEKAEEKKAAEK
jgi:hypothetical protein